MELDSRVFSDESSAHILSSSICYIKDSSSLRLESFVMLVDSDEYLEKLVLSSDFMDL